MAKLKLRAVRSARHQTEPREAGPRCLESRTAVPVEQERRIGLRSTAGSEPKILPLTKFMTSCAASFGDGGCIIDQPFQERLPDGMIRCYMTALSTPISRKVA